MTSSGPSAGQTDFADMQGVVRFAHKHLTAACFYVLRIADPAAARAWIASAPVTSAAISDPPPETALQIALTANGLIALGVRESAVAGFSAEFRSGLVGDPDRSRRLGDVGENDPSGWSWGSGDRLPHVLIMIYAIPSRFDAWHEQIKTSRWLQAFSVVARLDTTDMNGREPFGFIDGISQPAPDWDRRLPAAKTELSYRNEVALGEFVLGYPNEYGKYTDRPLLDPAADPHSLLPWAEDVPGKRDLARNGSYVVFRDLRQSVDAFWTYLREQAVSSGLTAEQLAERLVGRTLRDGNPLVPSDAGRRPEPEAAARNDFNFDADPSGSVCPLGAHIRRANPRTADVPPGTVAFVKRLIQTLGLNKPAPRDDLMASARFHRILRRGREYGSTGSSNGDEAGLRFLCLNGNIARQFEFVQSAWIMSTKFNGMTNESDPLLGNREAIPGCPVTSMYTYTREGGVRRRLAGVPQFVTVRGGAYFFMPGLRALKYLASL